MNLQEVAKKHEKDTGKKQYKIAQELGISPSFWSQVKSGKRSIDPDLAEKIEKYFNHQITFRDILMSSSLESKAISEKAVVSNVILTRGGLLKSETRHLVLGQVRVEHATHENCAI